jgi:hypothetical protein
MLKIVQRRPNQRGELWVSQRDSDDWMWAFTKLPMLLHQDRGLPPGPYLQGGSDLDMATLPLYVCKVPSVMFFPYVTFFAGTWFDRMPAFVIPKQPLNRLDGQNWLRTLARPQLDLIENRFENWRLIWMENDTSKTEGIEFQKVKRHASAASVYLLDEIRYVYDENKSTVDSVKSSTPSRHCFGNQTTEFDVTKKYLNWYIDQFNAFYSELLKIGKQNDPNKRMQCFISGLTVSRLAVDALTILSIDVPSVRKWQFFGFLDAFASLINLLTTGKTSPGRDKAKAAEILGKGFYRNQLLPALGQIPIPSIREEITTHTKSIYEAVANMKFSIKSEEGHSRTVTGPDLLRAYRNARHGYAINEKDQEALLLHSGRIPDDLPDLTIALWHYLLLRFPFT